MEWYGELNSPFGKFKVGDKVRVDFQYYDEGKLQEVEAIGKLFRIENDRIEIEICVEDKRNLCGSEEVIIFDEIKHMEKVD